MKPYTSLTVLTVASLAICAYSDAKVADERARLGWNLQGALFLGAWTVATIRKATR